MKTIKKMMGATLLCGGIFALSACNDETGTSGGTTSGAVETTLENYLGYANVVAQVLSDDAFKAGSIRMVTEQGRPSTEVSPYPIRIQHMARERFRPQIDLPMFQPQRRLVDALLCNC